MRKRVVLILSLLILFPLSPAFAQSVVLHLRNGDRITGTIVSESNEQITLDTAWQKGLAVPVSMVERREAAPEPVAAKPAAPAEPKPEPQPAEAAAPPVEPKAGFWDRWKGELQVGLDIARSEKNRDLWHGRARLTYGEGRFRQAFDYSVAYGRTDGILSANRMDGSTKTDWDVADRVFVYNLGAAGYDEIRKIDYQYEVGPGLGYRLITRTNVVMVVEGGGNYTRTGFATVPDREELNLRLAEDITWMINSRLVLEEKLAYTPRVDDFSAYRLRFEGTLKYFLLQNLSLNLSVLNLFDTRPAPGVSRNDLQIRSSLGVKF